jgi:hypothetical protein
MDLLATTTNGYFRGFPQYLQINTGIVDENKR